MNRSPHLRLLWVYTCAPVFTYSQPDARYLANPATPPQATPLQATTLQATTLPAIPLHATTLPAITLQATTLPAIPLQATTLFAIPLQATTLPAIPLQATTLPAIPLQAATLYKRTRCHLDRLRLVSARPSCIRSQKRSHRGRDGRTRESQIYCPDHRI